jgi:hypothetical protein
MTVVLKCLRQYSKRAQKIAHYSWLLAILKYFETCLNKQNVSSKTSVPNSRPNKFLEPYENFLTMFG